MAKFLRLAQVVYVPTHLFEDPKALEMLEAGQYSRLTDVQFGFVMREGPEDTFYVRYWNKNLVDLRTRANSERTEASMLYAYNSVSQRQVEETAKMIEAENG